MYSTKVDIKVEVEEDWPEKLSKSKVWTKRPIFSLAS